MSATVIILILILVFAILRRLVLPRLQANKKQTGQTGRSQIAVTDTHNTSLKTQLSTVLVFTKLSTARFFRDRLAQFFTILFPLIFLFVFGSLTKNGGNVSFKVAVINQSNTVYAKKLDKELNTSKTFKVQAKDTTLAAAKNGLSQSQVDGIIVLPPDFGKVVNGIPSGQIQVLYDQTTSGTGQTLTSVLEGVVKSINSKFVTIKEPITVSGQEINTKGLTSFDYTFAGLLGFSIIGIGIFGPVNVFPELKKQGILRRLHTTPLRVWQYFTATMLSQSITGLISIVIQFIVAIEVFNLKVDGNYPEIFIFTLFSIFMILGLGLAIGGWSRNERQAAPLSNIVVFPMLFLSGTFFPRYVMPEWLQTITNYLPLTPVIDGLRQLTTQGKNLVDIGPQIGLMAVWFIIIYAIAFRVFKWE
ncbi:MAG TPA: ABC transporter permease [Candidatus Saccharimonadales bacterium]|nr:ABC transporter permease [Candidatus Saccharimonadales bacterium]